MPFLDQYDLSQDLFFRKKVSLAMATAAVSVAGEAIGAMSPNKYQKRQSLAQKVLTAPEQWIGQFALAVVQNAAIAYGSPISITSSTNALPTVLTTATHGLSTGDTVQISNHATNTNANGSWTATVLTTTTFSIPVQANGAGTGGRLVKLPIDSDVAFTVNSIWDDMAGVTATD